MNNTETLRERIKKAAEEKNFEDVKFFNSLLNEIVSLQQDLDDKNAEIEGLENEIIDLEGQLDDADNLIDELNEDFVDEDFEDDLDRAFDPEDD